MLRFYANGTQLVEVVDSDYPEGDITLAAVTFEDTLVTVEFDNFEVSEP